MDATSKHYGPDEAAQILDSMNVPLYVASHQHLRDTFHSTERYRERVANYIRAPGFEQVIVFVDGDPVAQAFGYALPAGARWWTNFIPEVDEEDLTVETGDRTFALNELMCVPEFEGRGLAYAAHTELMRARPESRATLLVDSNNNRAKALYQRLGYRTVGKLKPFADSPDFDAMILPLPLPG